MEDKSEKEKSIDDFAKSIKRFRRTTHTLAVLAGVGYMGAYHQAASGDYESAVWVTIASAAVSFLTYKAHTYADHLTDMYNKREQEVERQEKIKRLTGKSDS